MRNDILKKIELISKYGFFASNLLNIGAMQNFYNLKEKCSKENTKNENNLKIENNFDNSFLLQDKIETCEKCNDIKKIKKDLTEILNSMEKIFLEVLNDCRYEKMKKLAKDLYFGKREDDVFKNIDKFQILLNLLDDDLYSKVADYIKNNQPLYNINTETISEFKKQFKNNNNKTDIVDHLVAEFKKLFTDTYKYKALGDGCFGLTYKSDIITTLLIKEPRKQPIGSLTDNYKTEEKLKKLKTDEYENYSEKKDILPGYICQYYINLWNKIVILQMIPGKPYKDFKGSQLSDKVENNIKKNIYINNCFNDLKNKIGYRLVDRHGDNMIICPNGYIHQIDIDNYSFSKDEKIDTFYFSYLEYLILNHKNGTSFSDLEKEDFEIYQIVSEYFKIYEVDFLHCIINNTYRKSPMFYLFNLINSLVEKKNTYYCSTNNNTFIKILKFIDNVNRFKDKINNNKLFTLFSLVYNGNEKNYNEDLSPLYLTNYKISQNNIDGTGKNNKDIKDFVNYMLKKESSTLDLDNEYIKSLDKKISLIKLNDKTIQNFNEFGTIFTEMENFTKLLDYNFLTSSNKKIIDLLHINDIVNKIEKCSKKEDFKENFYEIIFRINENNKFRNLKPEELKQLKYSDDRFLFKNKIEFVNEKIDIKTLAKLYNLNERETGILNFYKTFFLEKYLNYMLMFEVNEIKNRSIFDIYYNLHYVFFGFNELLNLKNTDLFYLNLFLFPKDIYRNFYNLYLKESAKLLYNSYIEEFKKFNKFNLIDILKVENFDEISINKNFDILDEFLGEDYLFKDLIGKEKYATYLYLKEERSKKIKELYNEFYEKGNGSKIIENYKNGLKLLKGIIDSFLLNDNLDVKSRANAIDGNEEYKNFSNKYLHNDTCLKDTQTISDFIEKLKLILENLNKTLKNIDEKHKKDLIDKEFIEKIDKIKSKFFESSYFKNLIKIYSGKIKNLDNILSKFLEKAKKVEDEDEDEDNRYYNVTLNEECVKQIFNECNEFLNEDEIKKGKEIKNLYGLKRFLFNCLNDKNIEDSNFEDLKKFKQKINSLSIEEKNDYLNNYDSPDSEEENKRRININKPRNNINERINNKNKSINNKNKRFIKDESGSESSSESSSESNDL